MMGESSLVELAGDVWIIGVSECEPGDVWREGRLVALGNVSISVSVEEFSSTLCRQTAGILRWRIEARGDLFVAEESDDVD